MFRTCHAAAIGALAGLIAVPFSTVPATAASHDGRPKVLLHVRPHLGSACQTPIVNSQSAVTAGVSDPGSGPLAYDVFVLLERGFVVRPGALEFGITYQQNCPANRTDGVGIDIMSWNDCWSPQWGSITWPDPGTYRRFVPDECPPVGTDPIVIGSFYLSAYSADTLRVDGTDGFDTGRIDACSLGNTFSLFRQDLGSAVFTPEGTAAGCNSSLENCPDVAPPPLPPECLPPPPPPPPPVDYGEILLHLAAATSTCGGGTLSSCGGAVVSGRTTSGEGPFYHAYVLSHRTPALTDVAGIQVGLDYDQGQPGEISDGAGIDIYNWTSCSSMQFPSGGAHPWPAPGSGNLMTWAGSTHCQTGSLAVAGYFYLGAYSPGSLRLVPHPEDGAAKLANCQSAEHAVPADRLGWITFSDLGTEAGCNPCLAACDEPEPPVTTVGTSWSALKTLIR